MRAAIELIQEQRQRQIEVEGWTPEHDDEHTRGELSRAAGTYAIVAGFHFGWEVLGARADVNQDSIAFEMWPWYVDSFKPSTPARDLVKAGALIVAEIERLQRLTHTRKDG